MAPVSGFAQAWVYLVPVVVGTIVLRRGEEEQLDVKPSGVTVGPDEQIWQSADQGGYGPPPIGRGRSAGRQGSAIRTNIVSTILSQSTLQVGYHPGVGI